MLTEAQVSRSGYYYWLKHGCDKECRDKSDVALIEKIFRRGRQKLGIRRIAMILLREHGVVMNLKKISRLKNKYGLVTKIRRKNPYFQIARKTLDSRISPNLLDRNFAQTQADKVYSTDISYLPYKAGRAYLSATKDLATNEIVAFNVSENLGLHTGSESLLSHLDKIGKRRYKNLMIHSDQGVHYTNNYYVSELSRRGVMQSMSRRGNCLDNAPIESFFGHLKDEVEINNCQNFEEVRKEITRFIHYYNNERMQWGLKKMTPKEYRRLLLKSNLTKP